MKRVLLTGGAGGIGIHVLGHIMHNTDWEVVIIDSFHHKGYHARLELTFKDHPDWVSRTQVIQHDLVCPINQALKKRIGSVNYILHLAALSDVNLSVDSPQYVIRNNIDSTLTMLDYASETPHEAFVYFSTDEVYGPVKKGSAHKEWSTHRPSNPYAASKACGEDICYTYWRMGLVKLVVTNTMNNYGEMQSSSKFPAIVQNKLNKDEVVTIHGNDQEIGSRFYIHSRNAADALLHILKTEPNEHQEGELDEPDRYHIVGDDCLDNLELALKIAELMNKELRYEMVDFHHDNPAHDIHYGLQDNKLRASGWKPPQSLDKSLKSTIEWQQEHREWIDE